MFHLSHVATQAEKDRAAVLAGEAPKAEDFKLYSALYTYKSDDSDDLQFEAGEIIRVFDDEGDWCVHALCIHGNMDAFY